MKLSDGVEAAIHCAAMLAGLKDEAVLPTTALAEFYGVSASYLAKHLSALVRNDILVSLNGPAGGFRLKRPANEITLLDIVLAIEGDAPAFRCAEIRRNGPGTPDASAYTKPCGIKTAMLAAENAWRDELAKTRVSDLVRTFLNEADPRSVARNRAFVAKSARNQT